MAMTRAAHACPGRDPVELSTRSKGATAGPGFEMASVRGHGLVAVTG
jgi:hypothetical protein